MKKLILMLFVIITISSCKKSYNCECSKDYNYNIVYRHTYNTSNSAAAYKQCMEDYANPKDPEPTCRIN